MKLKNKETIVKFINKPSPNHQPRGKHKIKFIILHYTGMDSLKDALKIFLNKKSNLSCHWLVSKKGIIYKIVDEGNIAWHAGVSFWKGETNINNNSIGIELENRGHGRKYDNFTSEQMDSLRKLIKNIKSKYKIKNQYILGHSDIAPNRKADPGEYFNWQGLAKKKLAFWPEYQKVKNNKVIFQIGQKGNEIAVIKKKLSDIGYKCDKSKKFDLELKTVIEAFQRRFIPESINGIIDLNVIRRINTIVKKS